jgi:predicted nucleic acid-binding protein
MVLVDTSVWVEHFRTGLRELRELLDEGEVLTHTFVRGELACGNLKNRVQTLHYMQALPPAEEASQQEIFQLIERRSLSGRGIGWIDAHLLASALLNGCRFWTLDKRLETIAVEAGLKTP